MKACDIVIEGDIPEEIGLRFFCNGHQGGDAGHGGIAELTFLYEGGAYSTSEDPDDLIDQSVGFIAQGDWEMSGLAIAIIRLADALRPLMAREMQARADEHAALMADLDTKLKR